MQVLMKWCNKVARQKRWISGWPSDQGTKKIKRNKTGHRVTEWDWAPSTIDNYLVERTLTLKATYLFVYQPVESEGEASSITIIPREPCNTHMYIFFKLSLPPDRPALKLQPHGVKNPLKKTRIFSYQRQPTIVM